MEEHPILFTKVALLRDANPSLLDGKTVKLEIDNSYTIGKSVAGKFFDQADNLSY
jgi:hypothetical protein